MEKCLASLDNAKYSLCFSSGLGAATAVFSLLQSGDEAIAGDDLYGGTYRFMSEIATKFSVKTTFVEPRDAQNIKNAITPQTKVRHFVLRRFSCQHVPK